MGKIYSCPHCRTQNFAASSRLRRASAVPLKCWKCGQAIRTMPAGKRKMNPKKGP